MLSTFAWSEFPWSASRTSESLRGAGGKRGLAYLFAAAGAGRLSAAGPRERNSTQSICRRAESWPCRRPRRSLCCEEVGGTGDRLDLIRITPNWPTDGTGINSTSAPDSKVQRPPERALSSGTFAQS